MPQDSILAIVLPVTLFFIMFSMGSRLVIADFKLLKHNTNSMLSGLAAQLLLLPLLTFVLLTALQPPAEIFIGFMILALSPGGTTSNMFSYLANGNLALSISLTAVVSLIAPLSIPLIGSWIIELHQGQAVDFQLPFLQTMSKLILVTLIPLILGMLLRHYNAAFCQRNERWITRLPLTMLLLVIGGIIQQNLANMPYFIQQTGIAALLLASLALVMGYFFARLMKCNQSDARTIAIETSIQNGGTAILVTGTILNNPTMTIAPVMYGILMLIPVFLYLLIIKRLIPAYA